MNEKIPEKYISILGLADDVLMFCLSKSFESYKKRNGSEGFQVSPHETENATSGILTIVTGLESYLKRLEYIVKSNLEYKKYIHIFDSRKCEICKFTNSLPLHGKISKIIGEEMQEKYDGIKLNRSMIDRMLQDLSKVRNNITHNYLYEFSVQYDEDYNLKEWNYTDVPKGRAGLKSDKTDFLQMNKIPNQISFMDVLKAMLVFDTVIKLMELSVKGINYRFGGYHKLSGHFVQNFYQTFCFYLNEMVILERKSDLKELNKIIVKVSKTLQVKSSDSGKLKTELIAHLSRSNLLRDTIVNQVSSCTQCGSESLMYHHQGSIRCLNCTVST